MNIGAKPCRSCAREMDLSQFRNVNRGGGRYSLSGRCRQCEAGDAGEKWHTRQKLGRPLTGITWSQQDIEAMELTGVAKHWRGPVNAGPLVATIGWRAAA